MTAIADRHPWCFNPASRDPSTGVSATRATRRAPSPSAPFGVDATGWIIPATDDGVNLADSISDALAEAATISKAEPSPRIVYLDYIAHPGQPAWMQVEHLRGLIASLAEQPLTWDYLLVRPSEEGAHLWCAAGLAPVPDAHAYLRVGRAACLFSSSAA